MSHLPHVVALVLDSEFGERVGPIASRIHVWLVDSEPNRRAAQVFWGKHQATTQSIEEGITTFVVDPNDDPEQWCEAILGTIDLHHGEHSHTPPLSALEVYGVSLSEALKSSFEAYGFTTLQSTSYGFCAGHKSA